MFKICQICLPFAKRRASKKASHLVRTNKCWRNRPLVFEDANVWVSRECEKGNCLFLLLPLASPESCQLDKFQGFIIQLSSFLSDPISLLAPHYLSGDYILNEWLRVIFSPAILRLHIVYGVYGVCVSVCLSKAHPFTDNK